MENDWALYIIQNLQFTYVGVSNNLNQRLRRHNGEIKGGSRYTLSKGPGWKHVVILQGLDKISALQLEWAVKNYGLKQKSGIVNRIDKLVGVLNQQKFTSKSRDIDTYHNLVLNWYSTNKIETDVSCMDILKRLPKNITLIHVLE